LEDNTNMRVKALLLASSLAIAGNVFGDSVLVTYLAPGVQTPQGITAHYATFNGITPGSTQPITTTFQNSGITGTYTGGVQWTAANAYGGAGGSGTYAETFSSYRLSLSASVNYFGLWFSALDAGNQLSFYNNGSLVYTFTPADFIRLVGDCPGTGFCGNPNKPGTDVNEQFAYLNIYDQDGSFNSIVFSQLGGGGFESDNHAVASLNAPPLGTVVTSLDEPQTTASVALFLLAGGLIYRRRSVFSH